MYKINNRWNGFVTGVINNVGWIIVAIVAIMTLLFTQLGTWHREEGLNIHGLVASHEEYGNIHHVQVLNTDDISLDDLITIAVYYNGTQALDGYEGIITRLITQRESKQTELESLSEGSARYLQKEEELKAIDESIQQYNAEYSLIITGELRDINGLTLIRI
jgi:hypothetical protein